MCGFLIFSTYAKDIRLHNLSECEIYAAVYEHPIVPFYTGKVIRKTTVHTVDPLAFSIINRPQSAIGVNRKLAIACNPNMLPESLSAKDFNELSFIGIGGLGIRIFDNFYVAQKAGEMLLYNPVTLKLSDIKKDIIKNAERMFEAYRANLAKNSTLVTENPYKDKQARVRVSDELCDQEKAYLEKRIPKVKEALEAFLETELNGSYIPKIAFINSGGGVRSMIACTGFHVGAQDIGLLDTVTYDVGLSGGSWLLALWIQSGLDIHAFKTLLRDLVSQDLRLVDAQEARLFLDALLVRFGLHQPVTLVNSWGALIANRYLSMYGDKRQQVLWSDVAQQVSDARVPFPIFAATNGAVAESHENRPKIPWFEITPFEVGGVGNWLGNVFVPTWAFGRCFNNGVSIDTAPQLDLGNIMGMCGSAFAFSLSRGYEKIVKNLPVTGAIAELLLSKVDQDTIGKKRFTVGKVCNFTKGMPEAATRDHDNLRMVDGGVAFNLPYPPVSGHGARKADILVFFDASNYIERKSVSNLQMMQHYAKNYGLKFPPIDIKKLEKSEIAIFKDDSDPTVPLVIYMPRMLKKGIQYPSEVPKNFSTDFTTARFAYTHKDFDALSAVMATNIKISKELIVKAIRDYIQLNGGL